MILHSSPKPFISGVKAVFWGTLSVKAGLRTGFEDSQWGLTTKRTLQDLLRCPLNQQSRRSNTHDPGEGEAENKNNKLVLEGKHGNEC